MAKKEKNWAEKLKDKVVSYLKKKKQQLMARSTEAYKKIGYDENGILHKKNRERERKQLEALTAELNKRKK